MNEPLNAFRSSRAYSCSLMGERDIAQLERAPAGDIVAYGRQSQQFAELHLPHGNGPFPVVVLVHGGVWWAEYDLKQMRSMAQAICTEGVAVWNLEYRRIGNSRVDGHEGAGWPGTFLDVGAGVDHLRNIAAEKALDLRRVVVVGHSAGGHLALWSAMRHRLSADSDVYTPDPLPLKGVLTLAPCTELVFLHRCHAYEDAVEKLLGGSPENAAERYRDASPESFLPLDVPRTVLLGLADPFELFGRAYYHRAVDAGDEYINLVEAADSGHFEMINPKSSTWPAVKEALLALLK